MVASNFNQPKKSVILLSLLVMTILSSMLLSFMPGGNLINIGIAAALTGMTFMYLIIGRRELWISSEIVVVVLWLGYALIPSIFAPDQEQAMFKAISMAQVLLLSLVMLQICIWQGSTRVIIWAYIAAVCASYIITFTELNDLVAQAQIENEAAGGGSLLRTASTLGNANTFGVAAVLAQALVVVLLSMKSTPSLERVIAVICFGVLIGAVLNSGSRTALTGMLMLVLGMAWVFSLWRLQNLGNFVKWVAIIGVVLGGIFYLVKDIREVQERYELVILESKIESRMEDFVNLFVKNDNEDAVERSGSSLEDRMGLALMAWNIANQHPFGVGLDNFSVFSGVYAHSNYLELLATTGFIGLVLYYLSYGIITLKSLKMWTHIQRNGLPKALALGIFTLALMDIANVSYYVKPVWIFLVIIIGTAEVLRRQASQLMGRKRRMLQQRD